MFYNSSQGKTLQALKAYFPVFNKDKNVLDGLTVILVFKGNTPLMFCKHHNAPFAFCKAAKEELTYVVEQ